MSALPEPPDELQLKAAAHVQRAIERRTRERCARLASIEAHYWAALEDPRVQEIAIGAMGAASNLCAAILMGKTPEQYEREVAARDQP